MKSIMSAENTENKVMNPDQFDRVVRAIVEGKYSWACVLVLRFAGYNPAHYIPYRTYKRLIKSNRMQQASNQAARHELKPHEHTPMVSASKSAVST